MDIAQAQQLDYNTVANVRNARAEDAVYMSRQATAYASAGVLSSGSPLAVEATTAGRLEQRVQQEWQNSQQQQQQLYSAAKVGQLYGQAQASAYRTQAAGIGLQNMANMFTGGARLLSTSIGAYQSGALNFGGGGSPVGTVEDGGDVAAITTR